MATSAQPEATPSIMDLDDDALAAKLGLAADEEIVTEQPDSVAPDEGDEEGTAPAGDESTATDGGAETEGEEEQEEEAEAEEEGEAEAEGDGEAPKAESKRELAIDFSVADTEGDLDPHSVADLTVTIPRKNGKALKMTLDKALRLVPAGVYNEEREARIDAALERERQVQAAIPQVRAHIEGLEARIDKLLSDPEEYDRQRESYEKQNTPEERARRAEERANALESENRKRAQAAQGQQFLRETLAPRLDALLSTATTTEDGKRVPLISVDELSGRFMALTAHLKGRDGQVPPEATAKVLEIVEDQLAPWAEGLAATRLAERKRLTGKAKAEADAEKKRAREAITLTKRRFVRPLKPSTTAAGAKAGSAQRTAANAGQQKAPRSADASIDSILSKLSTEM